MNGKGQVQRNFGILRETPWNSRAEKKSAAGGGAVRRNRPAGVPRNSSADSTADWYSSSTGRSRSRRRSPVQIWKR